MIHWHGFRTFIVIHANSEISNSKSKRSVKHQWIYILFTVVQQIFARFENDLGDFVMLLCIVIRQALQILCIRWASIWQLNSWFRYTLFHSVDANWMFENWKIVYKCLTNRLDYVFSCLYENCAKLTACIKSCSVNVILSFGASASLPLSVKKSIALNAKIDVSREYFWFYGSDYFVLFIVHATINGANFNHELSLRDKPIVIPIPFFTWWILFWTVFVNSYFYESFVRQKKPLTFG